MASIDVIRQRFGEGLVIPACPLALNAQRKLDDRRQRALFRYYLAAGAGGVAVGVHTTQFAIRDPKVGLFRPVLALAADEMCRFVDRHAPKALPLLVGGICGETKQAVGEAATLRELGYQAGLLSLAALRTATDADLLSHCQLIAETIPIVGFYLQPAAGGRLLSYNFWRGLAAIENVVGIKIAAFNRYQTIDVIRAVVESGRDDIALYTGNDDNIIVDLLTPFRFIANGKPVERRVVGGLLGQWAVWTKRAVEIHRECRAIADSGEPVPAEMFRLSVHLTDVNAALFDAANGFAGCIPGVHEVLHRQGLLEGTWCLDPAEVLSPGQANEIDRVCRAYPHLTDDDFVAKHRDDWLGE
ncbi:MAG TPA: dihydrodipicolinate synthase family protein [Candidatus Binatia bacterium]|nr:dihydrodipicolinate synthase family protein [Candidatus Binatia bacterium]